MSDEELLQIFVGIVDAKLFKTVGANRNNLLVDTHRLDLQLKKKYLLTLKFSKPKISNTPIELVSISSDFRMAQFSLLTIQMNNRP